MEFCVPSFPNITIYSNSNRHRRSSRFWGEKPRGVEMREKCHHKLLETPWDPIKSEKYCMAQLSLNGWRCVRLGYGAIFVVIVNDATLFKAHNCNCSFDHRKWRGKVLVHFQSLVEKCISMYLAIFQILSHTRTHSTTLLFDSCR